MPDGIYKTDCTHCGHITRTHPDVVKMIKEDALGSTKVAKRYTFYLLTSHGKYFAAEIDIAKEGIPPYLMRGVSEGAYIMEAADE